MTDATKGAVLLGSVLALGIVVGLGIGWKIWRSTTPKPETYAREFRQQDGSLGLEKKPQADAKPAQQIPKGATVERIVQVVVQPSPGPSVAALAPIPGSAHAGAVPLPINPQPTSLIRVDLTLVRMPDQTRRVIASSPDGSVVGGVDIPVEPAREPRTLRWAAGVVYGGTAWGDRAVGAFVDRDFAFLRTGAELTKNTYALQSRHGWEVRAKLGIRF